MGKCKTKAVRTDLDTFRHNQAYPGIIQAYSGIFRTLCNLGYLEPWYIQNPDIFKTRSTFRTLAYSQSWYIQNLGIFKPLAYLVGPYYTGLKWRYFL